MACALFVFAGAHSPVQAQKFPTQTVKIMVPYSAGGVADLLARLVGNRLQERWGVPVVIENRPGAAGVNGMATVAKSAPDGHNLIMVANGAAADPSLSDNVSFNIAEDMTTLGIIGTAPVVIAVHPSVPVNTLGELTERARKNPGVVTFASCGVGSPHHVAMAIYLSAVQVNMLHVPYRGCGPAVPDALSGQVNVIATSVQYAEPHIKSGALRGLAVTTKNRSVALPDVPTLQQAGVNEQFDIWLGLMAPAKTPEDVLTKIYEDVRSIVNEPDTARRMRIAGVEELITTREEHMKVLKADLGRYGRVLREGKQQR